VRVNGRSFRCGYVAVAVAAPLSLNGTDELDGQNAIFAELCAPVTAMRGGQRGTDSDALVTERLFAKDGAATYLRAPGGEAAALLAGSAADGKAAVARVFNAPGGAFVFELKAPVLFVFKALVDTYVRLVYKRVATSPTGLYDPYGVVYTDSRRHGFCGPMHEVQQQMKRRRAHLLGCRRGGARHGESIATVPNQITALWPVVETDMRRKLGEFQVGGVQRSGDLFRIATHVLVGRCLNPV